MQLETILQLYMARAAGVAAGLAQATGAASPAEADAVAGGMLGLTTDRVELRMPCSGARVPVRQKIARVLAQAGEPLEDAENRERLLALLPGPAHGRLNPTVVEVIAEPALGDPTDLVVVAAAKRIPGGLDQAGIAARELAGKLTQALGAG